MMRVGFVFEQLNEAIYTLPDRIEYGIKIDVEEHNDYGYT